MHAIDFANQGAKLKANRPMVVEKSIVATPQTTRKYTMISVKEFQRALCRNKR